MSDLRDRLQSQLGNRYLLQRELGGGGMSRVFVGIDPELGRTVVLKLLAPDLVGGVSLDRFRREMQVVARLQHPHIVPLLTTGDADGVPYYTMPFVEGESLRERLRRGELPVAETIRIIRQIADALAYAHATGVVHRDIKPENILLARDHAFVTDFGVAKALTLAARDDGLTLHGIALGTPAYMAPEQAAGQVDVDQRADIYALGVVAYELVTGAPPFAGRSAHQLIAAHIVETPRPIIERRPDSPPWLVALIDRCMAKQAADRPRTARDVIAAIDERSEPARLPARRTALALVGLAIGAAAVAVTLSLRSRAAVLDPNAIAVMPFRVAAPDSMLHFLREGMVDLIAAKLTGAVHVSDARAVLNEWRRSGGGPATDLSTKDAAHVARAVGAGRLLEGAITATPERVVISGRVSRARDGALLVQSSVTGSAPAVALLVDSLIAKLLILGAGERRETAEALATVPIGAIEAYLAAQASYRQGRFADAKTEARRALDIDSTFALAALRYWLASGWTGTGGGNPPPDARYRAKLSPRDRLLVDAFVPDAEGRPRGCEERMSFYEHAVAEAPEVPELWHELADILYHCGDAIGAPDPWRRALAGFMRATSLDSTFTPSLEHMGILLTAFGDSVGAARALSIAQAGQADRILRDRYSIADSATRARLIPEILRGSLIQLLQAGVAPMIRGVSVADGERILERARTLALTEGDRRAVAALDFQLAMNRGQRQRGGAAATAMGRSAASIALDAVFWDGDSTAGATAVTAARRALALNAPSRIDSLEAWIDAAFAAAEYDLANHDLSTARRVIPALRGVTIARAPPWLADRPRHLAQLLDAQLAAAERRPSARLLAGAADSMLRATVGRGEPVVTLVGNLVIARVWEEIGDVRHAYAATKRYVIGSGVGYLSTYARERGRLASMLGDREGAISALRLYLGLRYDPDSSLRADVDNARRELGKLLTAGAER